MLKYAKITNDEIKSCDVCIGTDESTYRDMGYELLDVEESDYGGWYITGYAPKKDLDTLKEELYNTLWSNYKTFQTTYVDAEDLTLAVVCASQGSIKGQAVQLWVMGLWAQYYQIKDSIAACNSKEELEQINITPDSYGIPPYTIRELNDEAKAALTQTKPENN